MIRPAMKAMHAPVSRTRAIPGRSIARFTSMPLEPLYTLREAARCVAMTNAQTLRVFLARHPGLAAARYRTTDGARLLTESELMRVRRLRVDPA